jgi:hypothetical protein
MELIISTLIGAVAVLLTATGLLAARITQVKKEATEQGSLITKMEHLTVKLSEIANNMDKQFVRIDTLMSKQSEGCRLHSEKITIIEQSTKSAHHRLDEHREKLSLHDRELEELRRLKT